MLQIHKDTEGNMTLLSNDKDISVFLDGLDHPEGVAWGPDGFIYAGGEIGQIYRINIETKDVQDSEHRTPQFPPRCRNI